MFFVIHSPNIVFFFLKMTICVSANGFLPLPTLLLGELNPTSVIFLFLMCIFDDIARRGTSVVWGGTKFLEDSLVPRNRILTMASMDIVTEGYGSMRILSTYFFCTKPTGGGKFVDVSTIC